MSQFAELAREFDKKLLDEFRRYSAWLDDSAPPLKIKERPSMTPNEINHKFIPIQRVETRKEVKTMHTEVDVKYEPVPTTRWFNYATTEAGQPGVFEIDPVPLNDQGGELQRFAYWNGRAFGPAANSPVAAFNARFDKGNAYVTKFRGLTQAA